MGLCCRVHRNVFLANTGGLPIIEELNVTAIAQVVLMHSLSLKDFLFASRLYIAIWCGREIASAKPALILYWLSSSGSLILASFFTVIRGFFLPFWSFLLPTEPHKPHLSQLVWWEILYYRGTVYMNHTWCIGHIFNGFLNQNTMIVL